MKKKSEQLDWLINEQNKDLKDLERQKQSIINEIKKIKKEDIVTKKIEKVSLWKRMIKVLMG
jgi:hypothetical protein